MPYMGITPVVGPKLHEDLDLNGFNITGSGSVEASGALIGGIKALDKTADTNDIGADEVYGHILTYSGVNNTEFDLPPVVAGMFVTIRATVAKTITLDPDNGDRIILDGTALADGVAIVSPGSIGDIITLYGDSADGWTVISRGGAWASE